MLTPHILVRCDDWRNTGRLPLGCRDVTHRVVNGLRINLSNAINKPSRPVKLVGTLQQ